MKDKVTNILFGGKYQSRLEDIGKLALRLLFGLSLAFNHGWPTLKGVFSGASDFPDPLGLGPETTMLLVGSAEFVFVLFVIAGLFTRIAIIPVIFNFIVALFIFHAGDPFGRKEMAYLYLTAMTVIMFIGPGRYSMDFILFKKSLNDK